MSRSRWRKLCQAKRLDMIKTIGRVECEFCGSTDTLDPHHLRYDEDIDIIDIRMACKACHGRITGLQTNGQLTPIEPYDAIQEFERTKQLLKEFKERTGRPISAKHYWWLRSPERPMLDDIARAALNWMNRPRETEEREEETEETKIIRVVRIVRKIDNGSTEKTNTAHNDEPADEVDIWGLNDEDEGVEEPSTEYRIA